MKSTVPQPDFPTLGKLAMGSAVFSAKAASTLPTLIQQVGLTAINGILGQKMSHKDMNGDQAELMSRLEKNGTGLQRIAVLVPGFQLDGSSLISLKGALNNRGIPALFPEGFPTGWDAVKFRDHPSVLVDVIANYVQKLQKKYPDAEILLMGHSFGGTESLHAASQLQSDKIIPVTISGLLHPVGLMAYAPHALYYGHHAKTFAGDDPEGFIMRARDLQLGDYRRGIISNPSLSGVISVVNSGDGYLSQETQAGAFDDNISNDNPHVIVPEGRTPRHYLQGKKPIYCRDLVGLVLEKIAANKKK